MINLVNHKIGEQFVLLQDLPQPSVYRVYRAVDGKYYNRASKSFEFMNPASILDYDFELYAHPSIPYLSISRVNYLPKIPLDLVFEFFQTSSSTVPVRLERHIFGGFFDESRPNICVIYGTVFDPSGNPLKNAPVNCFLNKAGYFVDKFPVIAQASHAVTNDAGYFELPIVQGLNVTISVPDTSFTTTGYVPRQPSVEISGYCLVKEAR